MAEVESERAKERRTWLSMHTPAVAGQDTGHDRKVSGIRMVASAAKACDWVRCNTWVVVCGEKETAGAQKLFVGDDLCDRIETLLSPAFSCPKCQSVLSTHAFANHLNTLHRTPLVAGEPIAHAKLLGSVPIRLSTACFSALPRKQPHGHVNLPSAPSVHGCAGQSSSRRLVLRLQGECACMYVLRGCGAGATLLREVKLAGPTPVEPLSPTPFGMNVNVNTCPPSCGRGRDSRMSFVPVPGLLAAHNYSYP